MEPNAYSIKSPRLSMIVKRQCSRVTQQRTALFLLLENLWHISAAMWNCTSQSTLPLTLARP
jgi:hypothetical protein